LGYGYLNGGSIRGNRKKRLLVAEFGLDILAGIEG
jgi:hypothetical protein